jgi:probable F420-dependent oxidoreductase
MTTDGSIAPRPFRFATSLSAVNDRASLQRMARRAEELGYSVLGAPDHFLIPFAPLIALQAAADVTTRLRVSQFVLNQDLRHPAVLAKDLATLDVVSGGRLEVGIGAGWLRAEYEQAGLPFDPAPVRIARLEEVAVILKGLFADGPFDFAGEHFSIRGLDGLPKPRQRPRPPITIGGSGPRILAAAGRHADIAQIGVLVARRGEMTVEPRQLSAEAYEEKVGWVREAAGARFPEIELSALLVNVTITEDAEAGFDAFVREYTDMIHRYGGDLGKTVLSRQELMASPVVAIGTLDEVCDKLRDTRSRYGISHFLAPVGATPELMAPVIERLAGQ